MIRAWPLLAVVLALQAATSADREEGRDKQAYGRWTIKQLADVLRNETPSLGLWLDTSGQTAGEILSRAWTEALISNWPGQMKT